MHTHIHTVNKITTSFYRRNCDNHSSLHINFFLLANTVWSSTLMHSTESMNLINIIKNRLEVTKEGV